MAKTVRIGTRESRLAVIQAEMVADAIRQSDPAIRVELVTMKTTGDKLLDVALDKVGGKGLFVKELDLALTRGEVDLCVHSYKDMPMDDNPELPVVAVSARENPMDVLILPPGTERPDPEKPVGCSSLRRQVQLARLYPGQPLSPIRGNVLTRLEKLDRGEFSALVLAAAGIKRLGLWERVSRVFTAEEMLPAACQGILAVQGRRGEDYSYLANFHDPEAWNAALTERAFIRRLGCGCGEPVGAYCARGDAGGLFLRGMRLAGGRLIYRETTAEWDNPGEAGARLADAMQKEELVWVG